MKYKEPHDFYHSGDIKKYLLDVSEFGVLSLDGTIAFLRSILRRYFIHRLFLKRGFVSNKTAPWKEISLGRLG